MVIPISLQLTLSFCHFVTFSCDTINGKLAIGELHVFRAGNTGRGISSYTFGPNRWLKYSPICQMPFVLMRKVQKLQLSLQLLTSQGYLMWKPCLNQSMCCRSCVIFMLFFFPPCIAAILPEYTTTATTQHTQVCEDSGGLCCLNGCQCCWRKNTRGFSLNLSLNLQMCWGHRKMVIDLIDNLVEDNGLLVDLKDPSEIYTFKC